MLGGVLEYVAIVTGYTSLLLVAAILYGLAFLFGRSKLVAEPAPMALSAPAPTLQPAAAAAAASGGGGSKRSGSGSKKKRR